MSGQTRLASLVSAIGADMKAALARSVPSGGTTGQVLTKSSSTDYATTWAAIPTQPPAAVLPPSQRLIIADGILSQGYGTLVSGRAAFYPMVIAAGTYDAVVVNVGTAQVGGTVTTKFAVYPDDGTGGMPNTTATPITTLTLGALTAAGNVVTTFSSSWVLGTTAKYWVCVFYVASSAPSTTPTLSCVSNCTYAIPQTASVFTSRIRGWARTGLTDLPTDATTTSNATGSGATDIPVVGLRRA